MKAGTLIAAGTSHRDKTSLRYALELMVALARRNSKSDEVRPFISPRDGSKDK